MKNFKLYMFSASLAIISFGSCSDLNVDNSSFTSSVVSDIDSDVDFDVATSVSTSVSKVKNSSPVSSTINRTNTSLISDVVNTSFTSSIFTSTCNVTSSIDNDLHAVAGMNQYDFDYDLCFKNKSKYKYVDDIAVRNLCDGDDINSLCNMLNMSVDDFYSYNPNFNDLSIGDYIYYPITNEYYIGKMGEKISDIAYSNGILFDSLNLLNNFSSDILENDCDVLLHTFVGSESSYQTIKGISNNIYGNKIFGDKVLFADGVSGSSQDVLVLCNERYVYGVNTVSYYCFDGNGNYGVKHVCGNAKDIDLLDGVPVVYMRTVEDVNDMIENTGFSESNYDIMVKQFSSVNSNGYEIFNDDGVPYIVVCSNYSNTLSLRK